MHSHAYFLCISLHFVAGHDTLYLHASDVTKILAMLNTQQSEYYYFHNWKCNLVSIKVIILFLLLLLKDIISISARLK